MDACRKLGIGWLVLALVAMLVGGAVPGVGQHAHCPDCCFEDIVASGCGTWWVNVHAEFTGYLYDDHPEFIGEGVWPGGEYWSMGVQHNRGRWVLTVSYSVSGVGWCRANYQNFAMTDTPPSTGWELDPAYCVFGDACPGATGLPVPTLSGGGPCQEEPEEPVPPVAELLPVGSAGFLDRGWPEGEEPPVAGQMEVSAAYEAGELVTGCCGATDDVTYLTLTWYAVTIGEDYDVREAIDSKIIRADGGSFCFEIDTTGFAPGYYDIRLGIPGEGCEWIRVEVVAPAE